MERMSEELQWIGARLIPVLLAGGLLVAMSGRAGALPGPQVAARDQVSGKAIYEGKGNCLTCHGKEAKGTPLGPDLTDGEWLHISGSLDEITAVVKTGVEKPKKYPAPMPPRGGAKLRDAEVEAVARYIHELSHPPESGRSR